MKHLNKFNETYSDIINDNMTMQDKMASSYQAFLFGCYLSNPNDFIIDERGNLVDERGIFTSDFNKWCEEGRKVPKQYR